MFAAIARCSHKRRHRKGSGEKTEFIILRDPRDRRQGTPCRATGESIRPLSLLGVLRERQGIVNSFGLADLNNLGPWAFGVVPSYLVPGSG